MSMIRLLPIWITLSNPLEHNPTPPLKSASSGYILPKGCHHYRTNNSKIFLAVSDDHDRKIFTDLNVSVRDFYSYIFEDVEFPSEYDDHYIKKHTPI